MALKIRLQRQGTKNAPVYRIVVAESANRRDGRFVELLGHYNPSAKGSDPKMKLQLARAKYWVSVGAQPSETVEALIRLANKQDAGAETVTVQSTSAVAA